MPETQHIVWRPLFTRSGFPYFIVHLSIEAYLFDMEREIGWGYRDQLYTLEKEHVRSHYSVRDAESFSRFIRTKDESFILGVNECIRRAMDDLARACDDAERRVSKKELSNEELSNLLSDLYAAYRRAYALYRFPTLVDSYGGERNTSEVVDSCAEARDNSGKTFTRADREIRPLLTPFLEKALGVPADFVYCMNAAEIKDGLERGKSVCEESFLRERYAYLVLSGVGKEVTLLVGDDARAAYASLHLEQQDAGQSGDVRGRPAYPGVCQGRVYVALSPEDARSAPPDCILVVPMTTVAYTPYLSHVSAIVTDEGGLTCHAAVIARELKKPCVVGTKNATGMLKDGDVVEVDANAGTVKKIS